MSPFYGTRQAQSVGEGGGGLVKGMEETSGSNKKGKPSKQTSILSQKL